MPDVNVLTSTPARAAQAVLDAVPDLSAGAVGEVWVIKDLMAHHQLGTHEARRLLTAATADGTLLRLFVDEDRRVRLAVHDPPTGEATLTGLDTLGYPPAVVGRMRITDQGTLTTSLPAQGTARTWWLATRTALDEAARPVLEHLAVQDRVRQIAAARNAEHAALTAAHGDDLDTLGAFLAAADLPPTVLSVIPVPAYDPDRPVRLFIDLRGPELHRVSFALLNGGLPYDPSTPAAVVKPSTDVPYARDVDVVRALLLHAGLPEHELGTALRVAPPKTDEPTDHTQALVMLTGDQLARVAALLRSCGPTDAATGRAFWTGLDTAETPARDRTRTALVREHGPALDALATLLLRAGLAPEALSVLPEPQPDRDTVVRLVLDLTGPDATRLGNVVRELVRDTDPAARAFWTRTLDTP